MKRTLMAMVAFTALAAVSAWAEDGYIESDGTQYINTGYYSNPRTKLVLDYAIVSPTDKKFDQGGTVQARLLGAEEGSVEGCFVTTVYMAGTPGNNDCNVAFSLGDGWSGLWSSKGFDTTRRQLTLDAPNGTVSLVENGTSVFSYTTPLARTRTAQWPLGLFASTAKADATTATCFAKMRVYGFQIYESGDLIHDYVPAIKAGKPGLYDKKTGGFLRDTRTSRKAFASGGDILNVPDDGYIASTGVQGINLGRTKKADTRYEIDFAFTDLTAQQRLIGPDTGTGEYLALYINGSIGYSISTKVGGYPTVAADLDRHTMIVDCASKRAIVMTGCTTNSNVYLEKMTSAGSEFPMSVFARAGDAAGFSFGQFAQAKVYGMKVYEGGELVMDLIPAVKDGVPGLYDDKSGAFLQNQHTKDGVFTADFLSGGDIRQVEGDPYIESDGAQFINTGYHLLPSSKVELDYALTDVTDRQYSSNGIADGGNIQARLFATENSDLGGWGATVFIAGNVGNGDANVGCSSGPGWASVWSNKGFDTRRRTVSIDRPNHRADMTERGVLTCVYSAYTTNDKVSVWPLGLFGVPGNETATSPYAYAKMRVYSLKIYESGTLVKDFRPYIKNGRAGLRDVKNANEDFLASSKAARGFKFGGAIESDGSGDDAYLSSTGAQMINTGYYANPKSRIEVDFAMNNHMLANSQERLFGATVSDASGDLAYGLYCNGGVTGAGEFSFGIRDGSGGFGGYTSSVAVDLQRHTAIADLKGGKWILKTGASSKEITTKAITTTASYPLALFADPTSVAGTTARCLTDMRIYSVKIYEDGDLKYHYLPYKDATRVGLIDVLAGGDPKENVLTSAAPLTVGGCGWGDDHAAFYENPKDAVVDVDDSVTLTAYAPAALSYQWYQDGEPLAGETGMELTIPWVKGVKTVTYTVRAKFTVNGKEIERESAVATVTMRPLGMTFIVR